MQLELNSFQIKVNDEPVAQCSVLTIGYALINFLGKSLDHDFLT